MNLMTVRTDPAQGRATGYCEYVSRSASALRARRVR